MLTLVLVLIVILVLTLRADIFATLRADCSLLDREKVFSKDVTVKGMRTNWWPYFASAVGFFLNVVIGAEQLRKEAQDTFG